MARYKVRANFDLIDAWQDWVLEVEAPEGLDDFQIAQFMQNNFTAVEFLYAKDAGESNMEINLDSVEIIDHMVGDEYE